MSLDICKYPLCHQHKVIDIFNASQFPVSFRFFVCLFSGKNTSCEIYSQQTFTCTMPYC